MAELLRMNSPKVASILFLSIRTSQRFLPGTVLPQRTVFEVAALIARVTGSETPIARYVT